jgi:serine/threonine-protein kinase
MNTVELLANRYSLKEKIGSGGMADVYLAVDTKLNRNVAIKILHTRLASDTVFVERFKREAHAVANLNHPNIVSIYDWGQHNSSYFIVMEILSGKTLKQIVQEKGRLNTHEAIEYAIQVCSALSYAHENKVVHRDIKPQNIVISPDGHVKVADFGIARNGDESATMTQAGTLMGTPQYFSPEQAQGYPAGNTSDIYSLGICIYEMLAGNPPFSGDSAVSIAYKQVHDIPEKLSEIRHDIPEDLEKVVFKALAKDPEERYLNANDLAADLRKIISGIPVRIDNGFDSQKTVFMPQSDATTSARPKRQPKKKNMLPWIILLSLAAILLGYFAYSAASIQNLFKISVPNVEGKKLADAQNILTEKGLKFSISRESSDEVPEDQIISQDPPPDSLVLKGASIKLVVSTGEPLIEVPDVRGLNQLAAGQALGKEGLSVGDISYGESQQYQKDEVMDQWPRSGKKVKSGSTVNLVINKGIETVTVPELVGLPLQTALRQLSQTGLIESGTTYEYSDKEKDTVINQSPSHGKTVDKGSKITLVVSKGPQSITLPNLYQRPLDVAKNDLANLGLKSSILYRETSNYPDSIVISQDPAPGIEVKPGDTVTLYVSKQPPKKNSTSSVSQ